MAKREFVGNIPYTDPAGINSYLKNSKYGESFIRKEYSRARSAMMKAMNRIEASGRMNLVARPKMLKEMNSARDVVYALSDVYRFLYSRSGSLDKVLESEARFAKTMESKHIEFLKGGDIQTAAKARQFLIYVKAQKDRKNPGYESILKTYQKMRKGNAKNVSKRMQRLYKEFEEWNTI